MWKISVNQTPQGRDEWIISKIVLPVWSRLVALKTPLAEHIVEGGPGEAEFNVTTIFIDRYDNRLETKEKKYQFHFSRWISAHFFIPGKYNIFIWRNRPTFINFLFFLPPLSALHFHPSAWLFHFRNICFLVISKNLTLRMAFAFESVSLWMRLDLITLSGYAKRLLKRVDNFHFLFSLLTHLISRTFASLIKSID